MKHTSRRWLISLILALVMVLFAQSALAASGTVNVNSLVLRKEATTKSDAIQTLSKGDKLEIIYKDGSWYKVKYGKYSGYVMALYVKTSASIPLKEDVEELKVGSYGSDVKKVQERLKELGYLSGPADGVYGTQTARAVKAFQARNGLTEDGVVGKTTLKVLESSSAKKANGSTSSSSSSSSNSSAREDDGALREGSRGDEVKKLQQRLKELGYYTGSVDGVYGSGTIKAIRAFQTRNGLTVDGVAGGDTLKRVYSSSAKKAEADADNKKEETEEDNALREGSRGDEVKKLQQRLKELGYYTGSVDGVYGSGTIKAIRAFQSRNGLTVDGVAGGDTLKRVYSSSAKKAEADADKKEETEEDNALREGSRGDEVKKLQQRLKELGYYAGSVDGVYGSGTIKAIKAFQTRNALTVDGVAGEDTLKRVYSSSAKKAEDKAEDEKEETGDDDTLRLGSKGQAVKTLQEKLKRLGYYKNSVDGVYGEATIAAVRAFQARNKLTVDGVAGTSTLKVLYSSSAKEADDEDKEISDELRAGSYGPEVKLLQKRLKELGYYKNSIDGSYGSLTVSAVKAFQKRNGLTVDGVAGKTTLNKLNSSSAKAAEDEKAEEEDKKDQDTTTDSDVLRPGSSGTAVKELQYRLKELGYYSGSRDGVYGSQTRTAVMAFQTRNGLSVDGIAGPATQKKLYSSSAVKAGSSSGSSSSGSSSGSGSSSSGSSSTTLKTNQTLKPGDSGEQVKAMQKRLNELGYYNNTFDGEFGYGTRQALIAFQKNNGLTQDGIAGEATLKKLVSSSAVGKNDVQSGTYVTERLDWFNGGASRIPRGAIFQVKDVRTGYVFTAKRQAGANHLDAEPLTAADTAILLKINGGVDFTWHRRPMLVLYNGRVYACSIYSEPHGDDTIAGNNFDGQFCLHFYGSKTHGTDVVNSDHQKCEAEALKATW